jgi:hypothetical protein
VCSSDLIGMPIPIEGYAPGYNPWLMLNKPGSEENISLPRKPNQKPRKIPIDSLLPSIPKGWSPTPTNKDFDYTAVMPSQGHIWIYNDAGERKEYQMRKEFTPIIRPWAIEKYKKMKRKEGNEIREKYLIDMEPWLKPSYKGPKPKKETMKDRIHDMRHRINPSFGDVKRLYSVIDKYKLQFELMKVNLDKTYFKDMLNSLPGGISGPVTKSLLHLMPALMKELPKIQDKYMVQEKMLSKPMVQPMATGGIVGYKGIPSNTNTNSENYTITGPITVQSVKDVNDFMSQLKYSSRTTKRS